MTSTSATVRQRDREATRLRILEAARELFAQHGYDHVPVRTIAAAAGANVALINRYFGSKMELFGEVVASESTVRQIIDGDPAELPRRLAEHLARQIHADPNASALRAVDRSVGNPEIVPVMREHLEQALVRPLAAQLGGGPDARPRALLAASVLMGSRTLRRLLLIDDLQAVPPEALVPRLTAIFTAALAPL